MCQTRAKVGMTRWREEPGKTVLRTLGASICSMSMSVPAKGQAGDLGVGITVQRPRGGQEHGIEEDQDSRGYS